MTYRHLCKEGGCMRWEEVTERGAMKEWWGVNDLYLTGMVLVCHPTSRPHSPCNAPEDSVGVGWRFCCLKLTFASWDVTQLYNYVSGIPETAIAASPDLMWKLTSSLIFILVQACFPFLPSRLRVHIRLCSFPSSLSSPLFHFFLFLAELSESVSSCL